MFAIFIAALRRKQRERNLEKICFCYYMHVETPPTCSERKPLGLFHKGLIEYALASSPPPPSHQTQSEKKTCYIITRHRAPYVWSYARPEKHKRCLTLTLQRRRRCSRFSEQNSVSSSSFNFF